MVYSVFKKKCCFSIWLILIHKWQIYSVTTISIQSIIQASHSAILSIGYRILLLFLVFGQHFYCSMLWEDVGLVQLCSLIGSAIAALRRGGRGRGGPFVGGCGDLGVHDVSASELMTASSCKLRTSNL
jgi:hypothetical protein